MIQIQQLKVLIPHDEAGLKQAVRKRLRLDQDEQFEYKILKRSIDARKKPQLYYQYALLIRLEHKKQEEQKVRQIRNPDVFIPKKQRYRFPGGGTEEMQKRPVIIGTGPAGLFCGLMLARSGFWPILLERGASVEERNRQVEDFWKNGELNVDSNVQFGEGGAGTFSDGKLNTLVKDVSGRNVKVLEEFVRAGAKESILYDKKPHIGTDELQKIVRKMREEIIMLGGEVRFHQKVTNLLVENETVIGVEINQVEQLMTNHVVLAIGHSARDTFAMLRQHQIEMQQKAFAVGIRIEHPQKMINCSQYGSEQIVSLGAADYKVTGRTQNGRGIYSFCMCPGGYVVNASSEKNCLAINGMSYSGRDSANANSALIVTVDHHDFGSDDVLAGVRFQQELERKAYEAGNGKIPVQLFEDFCADRQSREYGSFESCMKGAHTFADVRNIFPGAIQDAIIDGIGQFDKRIQGFARPDAILSGVESRTSSPVRICRGENLQSKIKGLYPCGEGAGYAGGITSAAMDGIKVAERIAKQYKLV